MVGKNSKNEMVLAGKVILDSNFDNLVRNLYVRNSKYNLTGLESFAQTLNKARLPSSILSNSEFSPLLKAVSATAPSSPTFPGKRTLSSHKGKTGDVNLSSEEGDAESQSGHGKPHPPPGKRPRILKLYR